jgi:hypothetical protein
LSLTTRANPNYPGAGHRPEPCDDTSADLSALLAADGWKSLAQNASGQRLTENQAVNAIAGITRWSQQITST